MIPSKEATDMWVALNRAQGRIFRLMDGTLKANGLPPLRWYDVLWELDRARDGLRPFELEHLVIFEQSNLSRLLQRLVNEGLVTESPSKNDGRGKVLLITGQGRQLRQRMWKVYGSLIEEYVGGLSSDHDPVAVARALNALIE